MRPTLSNERPGFCFFAENSLRFRQQFVYRIADSTPVTALNIRKLTAGAETCSTAT
jgi:hypothetical protein